MLVMLVRRWESVRELLRSPRTMNRLMRDAEPRLRPVLVRRCLMRLSETHAVMFDFSHREIRPQVAPYQILSS